jgi:hypothetical protein
MKPILVICLLVTLTSSARAQYERVVMECATVLQLPGTPPTLFRVFSDGTNHRAVYIQTIVGRRIITPESVKILQESIGENLTWLDAAAGRLNTAEALIVRARVLTEEKAYRGFFKAGFNLNRARSATVYVIGEETEKMGDGTEIGSMFIMEAKDKNGRYLGRFLGGSVVFPCK